jgi:hypothetical protein
MGFPPDDSCPRCGSGSDEPWYTIPPDVTVREPGWTVLCSPCFQLVIGRDPPCEDPTEQQPSDARPRARVRNPLLGRRHAARHCKRP